MRVALLVTCLADTLFPEVGKATVRVLERLGHEVVFPAEQTCCGQMHANAGYAEQAEALVGRMVGVLEGAEAEATVCPSGSCVAMLREQYPAIAARGGDAALLAAAERVAASTFELSEFLVGQLGVEDVGAVFPHRVTYHPTCHSLRGLEVGDAPLRLLRAVRGLELAPLPDAESCCGFGGTFAVKNPDVSTAMMGDKLARVAETGSEVCTAVDSSCLMHLAGGLARQRAGVRTMHLAEILAQEG